MASSLPAVQWTQYSAGQVPDFICVCRDGVIDYISMRGAHLLGASDPAQLVGKLLIDFLHSSFKSVVESGFDRWIADGQEHLLLLRAVDGRSVVAKAAAQRLDGTPKTSILLRACSSRQDDDIEKSGTIQRLADILAVCILTSDGVKIGGINPFGARMLGACNMEQVVGRPLNAFLPAATVNTITRIGQGQAVEPAPFPSVLTGLDGRVSEVSLAVLPCKPVTAESFVVEVRDVAWQRQSEDRARLARALFEATSEGIAVLDGNFRVLRVNRAFTEITGYPESEVVGSLPGFIDPAGEPEFVSSVISSIQRGGRWQRERWTCRKDGADYAERLTISGVPADHGQSFSQFVAVLADVTRTKHDEERIRYQANYDSLTGLPNRVLFMDRLWQALHLAGRSGQRVGLMYIDLDGFKLINDTLGHEIGDELLKEAAKRLLFCVRHGDTVARLGGDEFTIIMPNLTETRHASVIAQRMIETLEQPFVLNDHDAFISASIGITVFPDDAVDAHTLLKNADAAMYRAKEEGKANYKFFTADINAQISERMVIRNGLSKALERDEFMVYYQPKCDLATGRLTGVEALLRWNNAELGSISPTKFIPVMEETGLIGTVGEWVLEMACQQYRRWRDAGHPELRVAVNLSARQLRQKDLAKVVERALKRAGIEASGIELEITESMIMRDTENAVEVLQSLSDMGIHLAMDDFGTGYSSLSYLKRFPVHTIKIDRSFIADIVTDPDDQEIIRTIISMGHSLRRKVIAEGVESEEQRVLLRKLRCDEMQGYLLSRPVPAADIDRLLGLPLRA